MAQVPEIRVLRERCVACGDCVKLCPQSGADITRPVLKMGEGTAAVVDSAGCIACYTCVEYCRASAITISQEKVGQDSQPDLFRMRLSNRII